MAHVESSYLDASLEPAETALPANELQQAEALFVADKPLDDEAIGRIVGSQLAFEQKNRVTSDYCVESQPELENPNAVTMSSSILDNNKYFAPPRVDSSEYAWHTDVVTSHHQYAQSPNIYTNDYMTSEPSDYVYM